jgi:hypothetical protein
MRHGLLIGKKTTDVFDRVCHVMAVFEVFVLLLDQCSVVF